MTALHWAAFHGRTGHVRLLVEKKADLLSRDTDGKLPLHWAAQVFSFQLFWFNKLYKIMVIDKLRGQDSQMLIKFFFCMFIDQDGAEVHKLAKKGQYPAPLTKQTW